jgi:hypothetical protein
MGGDLVTTSRVPAAIDYLVALFTAAPTLGQAVPPVNVIDGPKVTADPGPLALWVGVDDITNPSPAAATSVQAWQPGLGRNVRQEALAVHCVAQAWSGDDDVRSMRIAADGIVGAAEDLIRADPTLGGTLPGSKDAGVTTADLQQGPALAGGRGMAVRVLFTIEATAITATH